ncbi:MAG: NADH-quinone oxidoreductase subunit NuoE [Candidatus Dormibacteria bacterium]
MSLTAATRAKIEALGQRYPQPRSAVLPSLWAVQDEVGFLTPEGMSSVAEILGLAASEVQAVSTFYSMYFDKPGGRHHAIVCVNVSCALRGADDIVVHLEDRLGVPSGGTTADSEFTWEQTVECLGACGGAPAMQFDHHFHENLTTDSVDAILDAARAQPASNPGPVHRPPEGPHPPAGETPPLTAAEGPPADTGKPRSRRRTAHSADSAQSAADRDVPTDSPKGSKSRPRRSRLSDAGL